MGLESLKAEMLVQSQDLQQLEMLAPVLLKAGTALPKAGLELLVEEPSEPEEKELRMADQRPTEILETELDTAVQE